MFELTILRATASSIPTQVFELAILRVTASSAPTQVFELAFLLAGASSAPTQVFELAILHEMGWQPRRGVGRVCAGGTEVWGGGYSDWGV